MTKVSEKKEGLRKGIGISFSPEEIETIDNAWLPGRGGVFEGRFESRTAFINYCVKTVLRIATSKRNSLESVIEMLDTFEQHPELQRKVLTILRELVPRS